MIGYVTLGVSNLEKSRQFYRDVLSGTGAGLFHETERSAFFGKSRDEPLLAICIPYNEQPASFGNGTMVAFQLDAIDQVDGAYARAIALGGTCEGPPGYRVENVFYAAYVRDLDGNKLAFTARVA